MTKAPRVAIGDTPLVEGPVEAATPPDTPPAKPSASISAVRFLTSLEDDPQVTALLTTSERRAEERVGGTDSGKKVMINY